MAPPSPPRPLRVLIATLIAGCSPSASPSASAPPSASPSASPSPEASTSPAASPSPATSAAPSTSASPSASTSLACPDAGRTELAPGLVVERIAPAIAPAVAIADGCLWVARIDPARFAPILLTATDHQGARTAPEWAAAHTLAAVINASMFAPGGRSTGLMVDGERAHRERDNPKFGAFLAFGPRDPALPAFTLFGRGCPDFDLERIRADYRVVIQNYRLLDCDGRPIAWKDDKVYSAAAVGVDTDGNAVLLHMRAPYRMRDFTRIIADPSLRLAGAMYVEGGPEATLVVTHGDTAITRVGSYESAFFESDDNRDAWDLPNVIGFR